ncbi:hypothetical protein [Deinococcus hopiensis]|uniref:Uncharacterized protein n=1 Tax=Deinococcus hopiensis KR-140 TaxID=695939 RepID=A0A1W1VSC9_9DEIO|nr:hypothetical protein [Deinococcus hopiensis]SMB96258.1 hypothetical protein SAMN00790413_03226 [Deinococcus hopiensis KR-140]
MKRAAILTVLGLTLTACAGGSAGSPTSNRPPLPTGVEVRYPAAPSGASVYLNLLTDGGESVYQKAVTAGSVKTEVDPVTWKAKSALAAPIEGLIPAGAINAAVSKLGVPVLLLHWVMWQDRDGNGQRGEGETLDLMSHDRVAYASEAVSADFTTASPKMVQHWQFAQGWGRAEHNVYLPLGDVTYRRTLESSVLQRYELHVATPVTSQ